MAASQDGEEVDFKTINPKSGVETHLFAVSGRLKRLSWNPSGLAAIVDGKLLTFATGDSQAWISPKDAALDDAVDLCMLGPARTIVTLPHLVAVYSKGYRTVLVAMSARCQWDGTLLYLFDEQRAEIWRIKGLQQVGDPQETKEFVARLTEQARISSRRGDRALTELTRLVGSTAASKAARRTITCP
jgi:hypothetical protein